MRIFNFLKRKKTKEIVDLDLKTLKINNTIHVIEDSNFVGIQSSVEDIKVYGWVYELSYKHSDGRIPSYSSYNRHIYWSRDSALDALIQSGYSKSHDYRILPIYKVDTPQYREYKIDKLLSNDPKSEKCEIKGWKLKEDYEYGEFNNRKSIHKRGSIFIQLENGTIIKSGNYTDSTDQGYYKKDLFDNFIPNNLVDEIKISDEKWIYPHLLKELKVKLKIN